MSEHESFMRQMDIIKPSEIMPITIIGSGASGSGIGVVAGKLGCQNITLHDGDTVELHNISNQYFSGDTIGRNKATALREEIMRLASPLMKPVVISIEDMFTEESQVHSPIIFLCVDGMENRELVFHRLMECSNVEWIIETRMSAEYYEVNTINMDNEQEIEDWFLSLEGPSYEEPCTERSVIYTVMLMAARAVYHMKKIIKEQPVPKHYAENLRADLSPTYIEWREGEHPRDRIGEQ